jgi:hypothetical protein
MLPAPGTEGADAPVPAPSRLRLKSGSAGSRHEQAQPKQQPGQLSPLRTEDMAHHPDLGPH